jgi:cytochrome c oxidase cbb3-type subunit IV
MSELQQNLSGIMTALLLVIFIGICIWSWGSKRKPGFDKMANLPLDDSDLGSHQALEKGNNKENSGASL